ncbi:prolyl oligopeptidase [Rhodothalassium salexigens DSM 2132]|uniref:Prolyl oligopeptidase n=3 Tax=Rhodothalassium salexigens TaxID=1086 RepID=A0A4R2PJ46_RHOSA|nr:prolyl oligopeptidase [Rhodothalassium salexigens DSM 2132]
MPWHKVSMIAMVTMMTAMGPTAGSAQEATEGEATPQAQEAQEGQQTQEAGQAAGTAVSADPYLWLEQVEGERALDWVEARNDRALGRLTGDSRYEDIRARAEQLRTAEDRIAYGSIQGRQVHHFLQDSTHVRGIWRRFELSDYRRGRLDDFEVLLDVDALAEEEGENWVYKGRTCLGPDSSRCLVELSRGGGDAVVVREFDMTTKSFPIGGFRLDEAKQWAAWVDEDRLLVATPNDGGKTNSSGYPMTVRLWHRDQLLEDAKLVFEGETSDAFAVPMSIRRQGEGRYLFVNRAADFFSEELFRVSDTGETTRLPLPDDVDFRGVFKGQLMALLRSDWTVGERTLPKGALIAVPLDRLQAGETAAAQVVLAPGDKGAIEGVSLARDVIYVSMLEDVKGRLMTVRLDDRGGWASEAVNLPTTGSVRVTSTDDTLNLAFVNYEDFLTPDTLYAVEPGEEPSVAQALPERFDPSPYVTEQHFATSADGTAVPYFVIRAKDLAFDGTAPTLQYGYGGFEIALTPGYASPMAQAWLKRGGVYVIANIRGGGEYGPKWHQAALKENRQRAYDDFIAVSEDLIRRKVTSPQHLGIYGGSNGGLLVGAVMTQRPDLYGAVVSAVPLMDMMRYHKLLAGASWIGEYGNPDIPEERQWIAGYSPYQKVSAERSYPSLFLTTSTKDDRVHPGHARKMAARMLEQGHDVLYYENTEGGHSAAANLKQMAVRDALIATFLLQELKPGGA